jgi:hypothetical protein
MEVTSYPVRCSLPMYDEYDQKRYDIMLGDSDGQGRPTLYECLSDDQAH